MNQSEDINLNQQQREAVEYPAGPLLVLAGAGSGKTRVLACRAAHLVREGLAKPWQILALTFTNKAAGELKNRTATMVGEDGDQVVAGTFHGFFARTLRREGLNIGIDPHYTIFDSDDRRRLIRAILKDIGVPTGEVTPAWIERQISRAKDTLTTPDQYERMAHGPREVTAAQVFKRYQTRLDRMSGLDFDDLLVKPLEAFSQYPDFLERLQERFRYILVDEFQDTNPVQYLLTREMALSHRNLCVVGDDDQAIYGFRGATVANILNFERDWPNVKIIRLEQNYRSTKPILDVAWAVIHINSNRHEKKLWTERKTGDQVELIRTSGDEEEALRVVGMIEDEHKIQKRPYNEMAVLYRTNAQSLQFERALRAGQISYQVVGGLRFYERKEIKDFLAYLRLVVNPADDISLLRIINYPPRGIGKKPITLIQAQARAEGISLSQSIHNLLASEELPSRSQSALEKFIMMIGEFRAATEKLDFGELAVSVLEHSRLKERLEAEEKDDPSRADSKIANLDNLLSEIGRYIETRDEPTIEGFLEEVALVSDVDKMEEKADKVNLLTLHSAKGLEFPIVYITGLEEGLLPLESRDETQSDEDIEEERRLFYVGATRARERLVLTFATDRVRWGSVRWNGPSRFLREIPKDLLKVNGSPLALGRRPSRSGGLGEYRNFINDRFSPRQKRSISSGGSPDEKQGKPTNLLTLDELNKGLMVRHVKFGMGIIINLKKRGGDSRIIVDFDDVGTKTLIYRFARLEVAT